MEEKKEASSFKVPLRRLRLGPWHCFSALKTRGNHLLFRPGVCRRGQHQKNNEYWHEFIDTIYYSMWCLLVCECAITQWLLPKPSFCMVASVNRSAEESQPLLSTSFFPSHLKAHFRCIRSRTVNAKSGSHPPFAGVRGKTTLVTNYGNTVLYRINSITMYTFFLLLLSSTHCAYYIAVIALAKGLYTSLPYLVDMYEYDTGGRRGGEAHPGGRGGVRPVQGVEQQ